MSYTAVGSYQQEFLEPLPSVFSIETDQTAVTFYSGAFPDDDTWVHRTDLSNRVPPEHSQVNCEVPRQVYEVYDTFLQNVSITSDAIYGDILETTSGGGTLSTRFEYDLQRP